jgi:hypothetical protein
VTGELPDVRQNVDVDFTLTLTATDGDAAIAPDKLLTELSSSINYKSITNSVDSELSTELQRSDPSFVAQAAITVRRTAGGEFYLRKAGIKLRSKLDWKPVDGLDLKQLGISLSASRGSKAADWEYKLVLAGKMLVKTFPVGVGVEIDIAKASHAALVITAGRLSGVGTSDVLAAIVNPTASSESLKAVKDTAPPSLTGYDKMVNTGGTEFLISAVMQKDTNAGGWYLSSVDIGIALSGLEWSPLGKDELVLQDMRFALFALHTVVPKSEWTYGGSIGAVLSLREGQFIVPVCISYDSKTSITTLQGTLPDKIYGQLDALASDHYIRPEKGSYTGLSDSAKSKPAPDSSPLSLSRVKDSKEGTQRGIWLCFKETKLTRARFKADYHGSWALTDALTLNDMGILFDVQNPRDADTRRVAGYIYGKATLATSVKLFAFIAGVDSPTAAEFWIGFSAQYDPNASLGVAAKVVIADTKFADIKVPVDGWEMPDFPTTPKDSLTSAEAKLLVKFKRVKSENGDKAAKTKLEQIKVNAKVSHKWILFDDVATADAELNVLVNANKDGEGFSGYLELRGGLQAKSGQDTYGVDVLVKVQRGEDKKNEFMGQIIATKGSQGEKASPKTLAGLDIFGSKELNVADVKGQVPGMNTGFFVLQYTPHICANLFAVQTTILSNRRSSFRTTALLWSAMPPSKRSTRNTGLRSSCSVSVSMPTGLLFPTSSSLMLLCNFLLTNPARAENAAMLWKQPESSSSAARPYQPRCEWSRTERRAKIS